MAALKERMQAKGRAKVREAVRRKMGKPPKAEARPKSVDRPRLTPLSCELSPSGNDVVDKGTAYRVALGLRPSLGLDTWKCARPFGSTIAGAAGWLVTAPIPRDASISTCRSGPAYLATRTGRRTLHRLHNPAPRLRGFKRLGNLRRGGSIGAMPEVR
jgi:hypothetical protein